MLITSRNLSEGVTGSNVRDTENSMRFSREGAERLGQNIRSGMTGNNISPNRNQYRISRAAGTMAQNVADNTVELQKIMESQGDETRNEISKLLKMMMNAQKLTGESSVRAIKEIVKQTEKITIAAGDQSEDVRKLLGIDSVQKQLYGGSIGEKFASGIRGFVGADQGAGAMDTMKQAFEPSRLFGDAGFFGLGASRFKRINAIRQAKIEAASGGQFSGVASAMEDLGLASGSPSSSNTQKMTPGTLGTQTRSMTPGIDRKGEPEKQTDLLQKILQELRNIREVNESNGSSLGAFRNSFGSLAKSLTPLLGPLKLLAGISTAIGAAAGGIYALQKLAEQDYANEEGGAIINNRDDAYLKSIGMSDEQIKAIQEGREQSNNETEAATPTVTGGLIKRGASGNTNAGSGPNQLNEQEFIINENGVERRVTEDEFNAYSDSISNSQASVNTLPTAIAVERSTDGSNETTINAPTVNNITNNNVTSGGNSNPINVVRDTIRDNTPVLISKLNKSYA
jgi:hypothetical protein